MKRYFITIYAGTLHTFLIDADNAVAALSHKSIKPTILAAASRIHVQEDTRNATVG